MSCSGRYTQVNTNTFKLAFSIKSYTLVFNDTFTEFTSSMDNGNDIDKGVLLKDTRCPMLENKKYSWEGHSIIFLEGGILDNVFCKGYYSQTDTHSFEAVFGSKTHLIVFNSDYTEYTSTRIHDNYILKGTLVKENIFPFLENKKYSWEGHSLTFLEDGLVDNVVCKGTYCQKDTYTFQADFGGRTHILVFNDDYTTFKSTRRGDNAIVLGSLIMDINVFLLCYNETALLPHTIKHYKKYMPSCKITIYDNESTDNSVELAKSLGCEVISWSSGNIIDDYKYKDIKNNKWKDVKSGWIIMADMDEFLCVTESELLDEKNKGTSILRVEGRDMIGESEFIDLSDIDLQEIRKYKKNTSENKNLCFLRDKIVNIFYNHGAHKCNPTGKVQYSSKIYINKHMNYMGLNFLIDKMTKRYERSASMRTDGLATHYTDDVAKIRNRYNEMLENYEICD